MTFWVCRPASSACAVTVTKFVTAAWPANAQTGRSIRSTAVRENASDATGAFRPNVEFFRLLIRCNKEASGTSLSPPSLLWMLCRDNPTVLLNSGAGRDWGARFCCTEPYGNKFVLPAGSFCSIYRALRHLLILWNQVRHGIVISNFTFYDLPKIRATRIFKRLTSGIWECSSFSKIRFDVLSLSAISLVIIRPKYGETRILRWPKSSARILRLLFF